MTEIAGWVTAIYLFAVSAVGHIAIGGWLYQEYWAPPSDKNVHIALLKDEIASLKAEKIQLEKSRDELFIRTIQLISK